MKIVLSSLKLEDVIFKSLIKVKMDSSQIYCNAEWLWLKLQSVSFASLSPSLFENLQLQLFAQLSSLRGLCTGTAPARMNLMF